MNTDERTRAFRKVDLLSQLAWHKDGYLLLGGYPSIRIVHYEVAGYYRGEDSGARYAEYDGPFEDASFDLTGHQEVVFAGEKISEHIEDLYNDRASWVPMIRHNSLVGYLLEHKELWRNTSEEFMKEVQVVNSYYDITVKRNPYANTITLYRNSDIIAEYDLSKDTNGVIGSDGPISYNIISGLAYKQDLATYSKDFDLFELVRDLRLFKPL